MHKTTRAQRERLFEIYNRSDDWWGPGKPESYRAFRKTVVGLWFEKVCIMVPIGAVSSGRAGEPRMWIGIEGDGYAHT